MKVKGLIRIKGIDEEITLQTDCSRESFIQLSYELVAKTDILVQSTYFDEALTDDEVEKLISV
jgi:hypothetical protein